MKGIPLLSLALCIYGAITIPELDFKALFIAMGVVAFRMIVHSMRFSLSKEGRSYSRQEMAILRSAAMDVSQRDILRSAGVSDFI